MIFSLSGIDASGKGIQTELLLKHLAERGIPAEAMHFPVYDSVTGRVIKKMLRGEIAVDDFKASSSEASLSAGIILQSIMTANRLEHLDKLAEYDHDTDKVLVLDRYTACAVAYGTADGLDPKFLSKLNEVIPRPHQAILIDITVEESWKRRPKRDDVYEANRGRLERVRDAYHSYFSYFGGVSTVDGMRAPTEVAADVAKVVDGVLEYYKGGAS